jgi:hypothetical protein
MKRITGNKTRESARIFSSRTTVQILMQVVLSLTMAAGASAPSRSQTTPDLESFLQKNIGLSNAQIAAIHSGQAVAKALPSRTPREIFLFGAVYVRATAENYLEFARDFDALRKLPNYLELGVLSDPPQLSDFSGFAFDDDDIKALKSCKPGNCPIQLPASSIHEFQETIHWSAPDANEQANQLLQKTALERLLAYQREGNPALGVYNDKRNPTEVQKQFAYMLSYYKAFPERLPDFYRYLLAYPDAKPTNVEDTFYWAKVKFGLKPTLRFVHVVTMHGNSAGEPASVVAEKQLYSSHYFETALDLTFCVPDSNNPKQAGFYLIRVMGSEQAGLTGFKGSIVRSVAVGRSVSSLRKSLTAIRISLEERIEH